jgi:hypothetical protein
MNAGRELACMHPLELLELAPPASRACMHRPRPRTMHAPAPDPLNA